LNSSGMIYSFSVKHRTGKTRSPCRGFEICGSDMSLDAVVVLIVVGYGSVGVALLVLESRGDTVFVVSSGLRIPVDAVAAGAALLGENDLRHVVPFIGVSL
jgi:hypothetical protein